MTFQRYPRLPDVRRSIVVRQSAHRYNRSHHVWGGYGLLYCRSSVSTSVQQISSCLRWVWLALLSFVSQHISTTNLIMSEVGMACFIVVRQSAHRYNKSHHVWGGYGLLYCFIIGMTCQRYPRLPDVRRSIVVRQSAHRYNKSHHVWGGYGLLYCFIIRMTCQRYPRLPDVRRSIVLRQSAHRYNKSHHVWGGYGLLYCGSMWQSVCHISLRNDYW